MHSDKQKKKIPLKQMATNGKRLRVDEQMFDEWMGR